MSRTPGKTIDLGKPLTQAEFGALVGIGQPAVSGLQSRGTLGADQTGGEWLRAYCEQLREAAAARSADDPLTRARTRLAAEQADRVAAENAAARQELLPRPLLEAAFAGITRQAVAKLSTLPARVRLACPGLPAQAMRLIEQSVEDVQRLHVGASLRDGEDLDLEDDEEG